jgi:hypothetical protein
MASPPLIEHEVESADGNLIKALDLYGIAGQTFARWILQV